MTTAQGNDTPRGDEPRGNIFRFRHDNGLDVVVAPVPGSGVVAVQVWVGVGSADETEAQAGLAHVHEHMLFKGTAENGPRGGKVRRGVGQIATEIEGAGGDINAWTSYDQTVYHVVIQKELAQTAIDVLADAVLRSAFDPEELARELEVILEEIKRSEDSPGQKASRALFGSVFKHHTYRRPVIGYADVVKGFTREHITAFFDAHYRTDRMRVVIVGDITADGANALTKNAFGEAQKGAQPLLARAVEPAQTETRATVLLDDVEEAQFMLGFRGPSLRDDDMPACDVLAVILGQGESSRLVRSLKREQQLCTETYAYAYTPKDAGVFAAGAHLPTEKLNACVDALVAEIVRVKTDGVTDAELKKAKAILASEAVYQKETVEGVARRLGTWLLATDDPAYESVYQQRIADVTRADIVRVAARYFAAQSANIVALLPKPDADKGIDATSLTARVQAAFGQQRARVPTKKDTQHGLVLVTLDNGCRVVFERDARVPIVNVRAAWLGGLRAEDDAHAGYTHLVADLAVKGNALASAEVMQERLDNMASSVDGFAGRNSFGLRGTFLAQHQDEGLSLFFESLRTPLFLDSELERTRAIVLEELRTKEDNPAGVAFDAFGKALWPTHPYRRDILGTKESLTAATTEALKRFYFERTGAAGCVLSFVGDVDIDATLARVERELVSRPALVFTAPARDHAPSEPVLVRKHKARAQTHLVTGVVGLTLADTHDKHALEIITSTLSGQGGRLFLQLRDKQSLCYSVSASAVEGIDPGSFSVYMGTSPEKVEVAREGIDRLLADVRDNGLPQEDIDRARRYLIGAQRIGLQRMSSRATAMALNTLYGLSHTAHLQYGEQLAKVTAADVKRVAQRLLSQPRVTAIVGP